MITLEDIAQQLRELREAWNRPAAGPYVTQAEAAEILRCSTRTIQNYIKRGLLTLLQCGEPEARTVLGKGGVRLTMLVSSHALLLRSEVEGLPRQRMAAAKFSTLKSKTA